MKQVPEIRQRLVGVEEDNLVTKHPESTTVRSMQIFGCYILTLHAEEVKQNKFSHVEILSRLVKFQS